MLVYMYDNDVRANSCEYMCVLGAARTSWVSRCVLVDGEVM